MSSRRNFLKGVLTAGLGLGLASRLRADVDPESDRPAVSRGGRPKNVIFMVADGCGHGSMACADLMLQRTRGRGMVWLDHLRRSERLGSTHGLVETASANSPVTDSAAGSSAWGIGVRVNNGAINITPDGRTPEPILVRAKRAGRAAGLVTTARLTHATPAGFAANAQERGMEPLIARQYLEREIDVVLGGGREHLDPATRPDGKDLVPDYTKAGYAWAPDSTALAKAVGTRATRRLLGSFSIDHLPFAVDRKTGGSLPSLPEMTAAALEVLGRHPKGFILQVEAARVDHAGHMSDPIALLGDLAEFDETVELVERFAAANGETLVIVTSDHGTGGLVLGGNGSSYQNNEAAFAHFLAHRPRSLAASLSSLKVESSAETILETLRAGTGLPLGEAERASAVAAIRTGLERSPEAATYALAPVLWPLWDKHTGLCWATVNHTNEIVLATAFGPGSGALQPWMRNTDFHAVLLDALAG